MTQHHHRRLSRFLRFASAVVFLLVLVLLGPEEEEDAVVVVVGRVAWKGASAFLAFWMATLSQTVLSFISVLTGGVQYDRRRAAWAMATGDDSAPKS